MKINKKTLKFKVEVTPLTKSAEGKLVGGFAGISTSDLNGNINGTCSDSQCGNSFCANGTCKNGTCINGECANGKCADKPTLPPSISPPTRATGFVQLL